MDPDAPEVVLDGTLDRISYRDDGTSFTVCLLYTSDAADE